MRRMDKIRRWAAGLCAAALVCGGGLWLYGRSAARREANSTLFTMNTVATHRAWGPKARQAVEAVDAMLAAYEDEFSMYRPSSDIARINAAAGQAAVAVSPGTYELLEKAKALSAANPHEFALTIGPLTSAWGVSTPTPRVVPPEERARLLALVDDGGLILENGTAKLAREGQAIDLGGIAKGAACGRAREIYDALGVKSALLEIGGNVYARGRKPDGTQFRVGFRDPAGTAQTAIAAISLEDQVIAVSGGYERYFEVDGVRYAHIFDPDTGAPAESDILSVGVIHSDGATADFYSTALYVGGMEKALAYMKQGGLALALDEKGELYVSRALESTFAWVEGYEAQYTLHWV